MNADDLLYSYLSRAGLVDYYPQFKQNGIGIDYLANMTMQDYSRVGITSRQDRKKLFELIQVVKKNNGNKSSFELEQASFQPVPVQIPQPLNPPLNLQKANIQMSLYFELVPKNFIVL